MYSYGCFTGFVEPLEQLYPGECLHGLGSLFRNSIQVCDITVSMKPLEQLYPGECLHGLGSLLRNSIQVCDITVSMKPLEQLYSGEYRVHGASWATLSRCVILLCPWSLLNNCILVSIGSMEPLEQRYPGEWLQGPWYLLRKCIHVNIWSMEPLEQLYPCEYNVHGNSCAAVSMWLWGPLSLFNNCFQVRWA